MKCKFIAVLLLCKTISSVPTRLPSAVLLRSSWTPAPWCGWQFISMRCYGLMPWSALKSDIFHQGFVASYAFLCEVQFCLLQKVRWSLHNLIGCFRKRSLWVIMDIRGSEIAVWFWKPSDSLATVSSNGISFTTLDFRDVACSLQLRSISYMEIQYRKEKSFSYPWICQAAVLKIFNVFCFLQQCGIYSILQIISMSTLIFLRIANDFKVKLKHLSIAMLLLKSIR